VKHGSAPALQTCIIGYSAVALRRSVMTTTAAILCHGISYRQGFIEVRHGIHPGYVNIESWMVDSSVDVAGLDPSADGLSDPTVVANTELELSLASAHELVRQLQQAILLIENGA
jgi:hypothetical protein